MLTRDFEAELGGSRHDPAEPASCAPTRSRPTQPIEQAIGDRKRKMLVAMATGTGKTLTMVNEVYRLMKSGVARRVLFLVDRRALAAQAVRAFASFEAEPGLKFDKIYQVYCQRFQQADLDEGREVRPQRHAELAAHRPEARATPSSTSARSSAWRSTCSAARRR